MRLVAPQDCKTSSIRIIREEEIWRDYPGKLAGKYSYETGCSDNSEKKSSLHYRNSIRTTSITINIHSPSLTRKKKDELTSFLTLGMARVSAFLIPSVVSSRSDVWNKKKQRRMSSSSLQLSFTHPLNIRVSLDREIGYTPYDATYKAENSIS